MTVCQAFLQSSSVLRSKWTFNNKLGVCQRPLRHESSARSTRNFSVVPTRRLNVRMLGPFFPNLGDSKLLKSEIVRREKETLERDYFELAKLGQRYEVSC